MNNQSKFKCRFCDHDLDKLIVSLPSMPLTDDFVNLHSLDRKEFLENINIFQCDNCLIIQNPKDFDYSSYYQDYNYSTGHSVLANHFMNNIASYIQNKFTQLYNYTPKSVLEVGSGDGVQLDHFKKNGISTTLGVEPSDYLCQVSTNNDIDVIKSIFDHSLINKLNGQKFDICFSSYTFDHMQSPKEYLQISHKILNDNSILAFEIHDLDKIVSRSEWCLFEHEHTIYLNSKSVKKILNDNGFDLLEINPLSQDITRANSLIVLAQKSKSTQPYEIIKQDYSNVQNKIDQVRNNIDSFIDTIPANSPLIGFGVGGRGVMTLAFLNNYKRFVTIFDSNYKSNTYLTPKTRILISGINDLPNYQDAYCIVFSFGYIKEISDLLIKNGFDKKKIISLNNFYSQV